jgi:hypothetical protein
MRFSYLRGQSLIELLIAMSVIIVGLTAASTIVFSNARLEERSTDEVVASNLAREGVEFAKAIRDSNWMRGGGTPFDEGLHDDEDYTGVPFVDGGVFQGFVFGGDDMTAPEMMIRRSSNLASPQLFVQGPGTLGETTIFRRLVTLHPICSNQEVITSGTCLDLIPSQTKIGIRVSSLVQWTKRNATRQTTIIDDLYDWR